MPASAGVKVVLVMDVPEAVAKAVLTGSSTDVAPPRSYGF
jgi:hypothetical protein